MILYKIIRHEYPPKKCGVEECGTIIENGEKFGYTASSRMEMLRCMDHMNALIVAGAEHRGSGTSEEFVLVPESFGDVGHTEKQGGFKNAVLTPVYHQSALQLLKVVNQPLFEGSC